MRQGAPEPLGATPDDGGTNFAVFSSVASRVELCLFDDAGNEQRFLLPNRMDGVWHGYLPGCERGQHYGYRVHGPYDPEAGLRCNPHQLLLDPYARAVAGTFSRDAAVFDYASHTAGHEFEPSTLDSAPFVPKSLVCDPAPASPAQGPRIPWRDTVFYEANVRGYTMRHPAVDEAARGRFAGMRNKDILDHLRALGVTSLELMPVHEFIDEQHLIDKGLRNFWGYNPISYFALASRYAQHDALAEFCDMLNSIHDAGIEVILDVVYNHTGESDGFGPSLSFRGLDNLAYYSTEPGDPGTYINDTGCGNTLNVDHPRTRQLVLDSLRYWHRDIGVDGFRFDLAPVLGRHEHGYSVTHPMLEAISNDEQLANAKLIAEPWDPGPGGYQLGHFPHNWAEWNDRYRDTVRKFWRGDKGTAGELAKRLHGSADVYEHNGRPSYASVNFVTSHDGFTLTDLVSYKKKHNEANGEQNRDGHAHNYSCNYGIEGPTDDPAVLSARRRHRLNLLATLLASQGTPLLLAGDEFGHSQQGNNNAYAQDNEIGWLNWDRLDEDPDFTAAVRELIRLRRETPLLRLQEYVHGTLLTDHGEVSIQWLKPEAGSLGTKDWEKTLALSVLITERKDDGKSTAVALLFNGGGTTRDFELVHTHDWRLVFASDQQAALHQHTANLPQHAIAIAVADSSD